MDYTVHSGYDIAYVGPNPQRDNYRQVVLAGRLPISGTLRLLEVPSILEEAHP